MSNLIGTDALSAINLTAPVIQLVMCVAGYLVAESAFAGMNLSADVEEQGAEIKHCALKTLQINVKYVKMNSLKNL